MISLQLPSFIPQPMSTRSLSRATEVPYSSGISSPSERTKPPFIFLLNGQTNGVFRTCIYKFSFSRLTSLPETSDTGPVLGSAITALVQSPAIDVVGIGYASGEISVYDVRLDERLMRMFMDGGIRALGFRNGPHLFTLRRHTHSSLWFLSLRWSANTRIRFVCWSYSIMGSQ